MKSESERCRYSLFIFAVIGSPRRAVGQTLMTTLVANPLAVLLRALVLNRATIPASFLAFTLAYRRAPHKV